MKFSTPADIELLKAVDECLSDDLDSFKVKRSTLKIIKSLIIRQNLALEKAIEQRDSAMNMDSIRPQYRNDYWLEANKEITAILNGELK